MSETFSANLEALWYSLGNNKRLSNNDYYMVHFINDNDGLYDEADEYGLYCDKVCVCDDGDSVKVITIIEDDVILMAENVNLPFMVSLKEFNVMSGSSKMTWGKLAQEIQKMPAEIKNKEVLLYDYSCNGKEDFFTPMSIEGFMAEKPISTDNPPCLCFNSEEGWF